MTSTASTLQSFTARFSLFFFRSTLRSPTVYFIIIEILTFFFILCRILTPAFLFFSYLYLHFGLYIGLYLYLYLYLYMCLYFYLSLYLFLYLYLYLYLIIRHTLTIAYDYAFPHSYTPAHTYTLRFLTQLRKRNPARNMTWVIISQTWQPPSLLSGRPPKWPVTRTHNTDSHY